METHDERFVSLASGVEGDARGKPGRRQVTVLTREAWEAAAGELAWTTRRANLLVEGIELVECVERQLRIGKLILEISEECDPCRVMDLARPGLRRELEPDWQGGVCCRVASEARIHIGDPVELLTASGSR